MTRSVAALLAALSIVQVLTPAARAHAQAAEPFPEIVLPARPRASHGWAYASMLAGVGLVGGSFAFANRANQAYADYLEATDPGRIQELFDETERYDRLSSGSLLTGEVLLAVGLYLRFVRNPPASRLSWSWTPERCAVSLRF